MVALFPSFQVLLTLKSNNLQVKGFWSIVPSISLVVVVGLFTNVLNLIVLLESSMSPGHGFFSADKVLRALTDWKIVHCPMRFPNGSHSSILAAPNHRLKINTIIIRVFLHQKHQLYFLAKSSFFLLISFWPTITPARRSDRESGMILIIGPILWGLELKFKQFNKSVYDC